MEDDRDYAFAPDTSPLTEAQRSGLVRISLTFLFAAALALLGAGYALNVEALRLGALLGVLFFGVGTAPLQLSEGATLTTRLGVAGAMGLSLTTIVASAMVLWPAWHPVLAAVTIGVLACAVHIEACRRALPIVRDVRLGSAPDRHLMLNSSVIATAAGTAVWSGVAIATGHVTPGVGGFLPKISPLWYAGLFLVVLGFMLGRSRHEAHSIFALGSLVGALTLTPALLYGMPTTHPAANHVDLVQQILTVHHLDRTKNIYDVYSGLFSATAWLCELARVKDVIGLATYWPFIVGLIRLVELRFVFGRVIHCRKRIWDCVALAVLASPVLAQTYFSPQSVGFVLGLSIFGLTLGSRWSGLSDRLRVLLLVLAGCSLAVTHELSPFIVGAVLFALVSFRCARPWYSPGICLIPASMWALFNHQAVGKYITFSSLENLANFAPPRLPANPGLHRSPMVSWSSHALLLGILILIALACAGFARAAKLPRNWGFLMAAGAGLPILIANPYGNEGIFRAVIFGVPWLAILAAPAMPLEAPRWLNASFCGLLLVLLCTFLIAMFGLDNETVIRPGEFRAMNVYQARAPESSYLLDLSYGPLPSTVIFPAFGHMLKWKDVPNRFGMRISEASAPGATELAKLYIEHVRSRHGASPRQLYALWSPASAGFAFDYGLESPRQAQAWRKYISASPYWQIVYQSDGSYLFRVNPVPRGVTTRRFEDFTGMPGTRRSTPAETRQLHGLG